MRGPIDTYPTPLYADGMNGPTIDGHNDTLLALADREDRVSAFGAGYDGGHLDLPRAREAGLGAALFAAFVPNEEMPERRATDDGYDYPLPDPVDPERARRLTYEALACLHQWAAEVDGFRILRTVADLDDCLATWDRPGEPGEGDGERGKGDGERGAGGGEGDPNGDLGAIFHLEGAEAIDPDCSNLDFLYEAGLRSVGPVWSRSNEFAHGGRFRYPGHPDTGPGLTDAGRRLLAECERRGILVDCAHMTEQGVFDAAEVLAGPLVVSHTGAHARCEHTRNLTDEQIDAVADAGGIVGINFGTGILAPPDEDPGIATIADHVEYVADRVGVEYVGLGSDFDGATVPDEVGDVTGLPAVLAALDDRGFDDEDLAKVARGNWRRVLADAWAGPR